MFRKMFWINGHCIEIEVVSGFDAISIANIYVNKQRFVWSHSDQRQKKLVEKAFDMLERELAPLPIV